MVRDACCSIFCEKGKKVSAARYVQTLNKLRHALRDKRPKKKTVILQHDNPRPHTARLTLQIIQKNGWELFFHPP
jgi:rhamnogalacturonyl hydrolase YesR